MVGQWIVVGQAHANVAKVAETVWWLVYIEGSSKLLWRLRLGHHLFRCM